MTALLLCGCGASSGGATASPPMADMAAEAADASYGMEQNAAGAADPQAPSSPPSANETPSPAPDDRLQSAKLIYTASLELETTAFDQADRDLATLVEQMGGYFEQSSVGNYGSGYRSGSYTVRVPSAQFQPFCDQMGNLCHLTYKSSQADNISETYYDTESRLTTQRTKLDRLQALLAQADKMEDIITLESAISETELAIEQLSGTLRSYDSLVDYATVYLTLSEVYQLSNTEEPVTGFAQRFSTAFSSGWKNFISGTQSLLVALAYAWPWLLVLAVIAVSGVTLVIRRRHGKQPPKAPDAGSTHLPPPPNAE